MGIYIKLLYWQKVECEWTIGKIECVREAWNINLTAFQAFLKNIQLNWRPQKLQFQHLINLINKVFRKFHIFSYSSRHKKKIEPKKSQNLTFLNIRKKSVSLFSFFFATVKCWEWHQHNNKCDCIYFNQHYFKI